MDQERKPGRFFGVSYWELLRIFVFSGARVFAMVMCVAWPLRLYIDGEFSGFMFWIMYPLSVFGLWQAFELLKKAMGLTAKAPPQ